MAQTQKLQFIIEAENKADQALKSVSSSLGGMQKKLDDLQPAFKKMATVGAAAFAGISAIAISSFKASADAAAQMDLATNTLNNTLEGMSAKGLNKIQKEVGAGVDIFEAMREKMVEAGNAAVKMSFDDETAATAYSRLFQITQDTTATQTELNLAMDLARYSGRDLESATDALIKVHAGGTRVLKEFGIEVKEGTTATEAFRIVQEKTAGSAQTFADSAQGGMERVNIQMQNLQETVGDALAPAFLKLLNAVTPLIESFATWAEKNPELLANIILVAGGVTALITVVGTLGVALPVIISALGTLGTVLAFIAANPIVIIIAAIVALVGYFVYLVKTTGSVKGALESLGQTIAGWWAAIGGEWLMQKIQGLIDAFNRLSIVQGIKSLGAGISNFVSGRAIGGPVASGQSYMVGENGPEMFTPSTAGRISPNGSMGGIVINITGNSFVGEDNIAEKIGNDIMKILKQNVKIT